MIKIVNASDYKAPGRPRGLSRPEVAAAVSEIINDIILRGDEAVRELTEKFDGCRIDDFEIPGSVLEAAVHETGPELIDVMERAARNIETFHRNQIRQGFVITPGDGAVLGQRLLPVSRAGIYIPGGTAAYPSCVLMDCIPAKLAGVGEIILATPPDRNGAINPAILAAAKIAGVDRVLSIGGAQAIAALAYGTETIPRVDKIVGAGNAYVAEAKRQVFGVVGIDMIAGPSDILIIADNSADPDLLAADMLSQCEHGADSAAILITESKELASKVGEEITEQIGKLPRAAAAGDSIDRNGIIIVAESLKQAFDISNELAPEHLEIFLKEPFSYLGMVNNAGAVFLGSNTPVAVGDYYAGPANTIPTSGTARFSSPLSVDDFIKKSSFTYYSSGALREYGGDIMAFARKEGLEAHALAVERRLTKQGDSILDVDDTFRL